MKTTIDFTDELLRQAKVRPALEGVKLKDLIIYYLKKGLRQGVLPSAAPRRRQRSELPVVQVATGRSLHALTNVDIHRILDYEDISGGRRG